MTCNNSSQPRRRGRPNQTELQRLRTAMTFFSLKRESGLSLAKLERQYLSDCFPGRIERMEDDPDDFGKYSRGVRSPRNRDIERSPLHWALARYPAVIRTYDSLLFPAIESGYEFETLTDLSVDLWKSSTIPREMMFAAFRGVRPSDRSLPLFWFPIGVSPGDAITFLKCPELDALTALVIALKTNSGTPSEELCALLVVKWVQFWTEVKGPPPHLIKRLVGVLAEHLPAARALFEASR